MVFAVFCDFSGLYAGFDLKRSTDNYTVMNINLDRYKMMDLGVELLRLKRQEYDAVVIAVGLNEWVMELLSLFRRFDIKKPVYILKHSAYASHLQVVKPVGGGVLEDRFTILKDGASEPYMHLVNMHVCDNCNLNCKGCAQLSPFCKTPVVNSVEQWARDIERISSVYKIGFLTMAGGEPLLAKNVVEDFVKVTRKFLPDTELLLLTNGLLLPTMSESFWKTLQENNIGIDISVYPDPAVHAAMPKIQELTDRYGVELLCHAVGRFVAKLREKPDDNRALLNQTFCTGRACYTLYKGNIYKCPDVTFVKYINEAGGTHLRCDDCISVEDAVNSPIETLEKLQEPIDMCRYCDCADFRPFPWERVTGKPNIKDWFVPDEPIARNFVVV